MTKTIKEGDCFYSDFGNFVIFDKEGMHKYNNSGEVYDYAENKHICCSVGDNLEYLGFQYMGNCND